MRTKIERRRRDLVPVVLTSARDLVVVENAVDTYVDGAGLEASGAHAQPEVVDAGFERFERERGVLLANALTVDTVWTIVGREDQLRMSALVLLKHEVIVYELGALDFENGDSVQRYRLRVYTAAAGREGGRGDETEDSDLQPPRYTERGSSESFTVTFNAQSHLHMPLSSRRAGLCVADPLQRGQKRRPPRQPVAPLTPPIQGAQIKDGLQRLWGGKPSPTKFDGQSSDRPTNGLCESTQRA